ncbi:FAD/NAD(P)-binding protein [Streptomyces palmae]|uniref:FAD/NAD(P)-binding protein n=1 Tax=Streptomyces palmae TaxID=1701085 RepID=A0A4Z0HDV1_9ACTN|nr:FAD/NAD(P)-binding protein [Streptomyces palmae]TGB19125.1 FAD/NAD(P)-binding protein [Streptomyces palmae]
MSATRLDICLVGAGPRGLSVLERLCANARQAAEHRAITVHVVDPYAAGAGRVWRTGQSHHLLMNTVACQVTVFTDDSVAMAGPLEAGPSLYEWARSVAGFESQEEAEVEPWVRAEALALGPDSYPTRALYGRYLEWAFGRVVARAPGTMTLRVHRQAAVALDDAADGTQTVTLADGTPLTALHAVVLAQGHLDLEASPTDRDLASFAAERGLIHQGPSNPADTVDRLAAVGPDEPVLLRGLGLNFFDHMALFTEGRGGRYERRGGRLVYLPSGREPRLFAGSRRGVPYHSRGENEKGVSGRHQPLLLTPDFIAKVRDRAAAAGTGIDFREVLWPLVAKEVETAYYAALLTARGEPERARELRELYPVCEPDGGDGGEEDRLLTRLGVAPADRWDWELVQRPYRDRRFTDPEDFHDWLVDHLRKDLAAARAGNVSGPLKAALDVLRDLRNEIRQLVDHCGLDGDSHREDLDGWYTPLNAYLSIGPPAARIEQLIALLEAGVVRVLGPGTRAWADPETGLFTAESPAVPGSRVRARALVEARLPETDLRRTADPLLRHLLGTGQCRPYRIPSGGGGGHLTGGLAVTPRPYRVVDAAGRPHPARFAFGVPTEAVHWVTAAGIRPGVDSVTLGDSDAIARAVLDLPGTPVPPGGPRRAGAPRPRPGSALTRTAPGDR